MPGANPFAADYVAPQESASVFDMFDRNPKPKADPKPLPEYEKTPDPLITEPGAYADITAEDYHGREICASPSISATGLKLIASRSPLHYWYQSPLNPDRPAQKEKPHFAIGKAVHDLLLLSDRWGEKYHILPDGFDARYKKWAWAVEMRQEAEDNGLTVLTKQQADHAMAMAESIASHELAGALLTSGRPEMTLAAQDPKTGIWLRARPDVLPDAMEIIPDIKTDLDGSPIAFAGKATRLGYFQAAAHYIDVIDLVFGWQARRFVLIVVEKEPPFIVTIYHLDDDDIQRGRMVNRKAINTFAECLKLNSWPPYSPPGHPIVRLQMGGWAARQIDDAIDRGELSYDL